MAQCSTMFVLSEMMYHSTCTIFIHLYNEKIQHDTISIWECWEDVPTLKGTLLMLSFIIYYYYLYNRLCKATLSMFIWMMRWCNTIMWVCWSMFLWCFQSHLLSVSDKQCRNYEMYATLRQYPEDNVSKTFQELTSGGVISRNKVKVNLTAVRISPADYMFTYLHSNTGRWCLQNSNFALGFAPQLSPPAPQ